METPGKRNQHEPTPRPRRKSRNRSISSLRKINLFHAWIIPQDYGRTSKNLYCSKRKPTDQPTPVVDQFYCFYRAWSLSDNYFVSYSLRLLASSLHPVSKNGTKILLFFFFRWKMSNFLLALLGVSQMIKKNINLLYAN